MKKSFSGVVVLSLAVAGIAQMAGAAPVAAKAGASKPGVRVVQGARALTVADKASITGKGVDGDCCCPSPPPPTDLKPGYGFGTTGHYGPPGQDFTPEQSWRRWVAAGNTDLTPAGHNLPGQALVRP
jgi:hypothetical protein